MGLLYCQHMFDNCSQIIEARAALDSRVRVCLSSIKTYLNCQEQWIELVLILRSKDHLQKITLLGEFFKYSDILRLDIIDFSSTIGVRFDCNFDQDFQASCLFGRPPMSESGAMPKYTLPVLVELFQAIIASVGLEVKVLLEANAPDGGILMIDGGVCGVADFGEGDEVRIVEVASDDGVDLRLTILARRL